MVCLKPRRLFFCLSVVLALPAARMPAQTVPFGERRDLGLIEYAKISEASGMAASRKNKGVLWAHNDSGDKQRLYAFDTAGKHVGVFGVPGANARDWEDMALGPGPEEARDYLYIGDIGDNAAQHEVKYIYRVPEPQIALALAPVELTLTEVETIAFQYPDGNRDAETLLLDPRTKDLYVISKREANARVYRAAYPQSITETITLEHVATLPFGGAVAGDVAPDGGEILVKTYDAIYYWKRQPEQNLAQALSQAPARVPYVIEPQGEAVCWHPEGKGYYTLSEEFHRIPARLYFYPRLQGAAGGAKAR